MLAAQENGLRRRQRPVEYAEPDAEDEATEAESERPLKRQRQSRARAPKKLKGRAPESKARRNRTTSSKPPQAQYVGVSWDKDRSKWDARLFHERKTVHLGRFADPKEAALAVDKASRELRGNQAHGGRQSPNAVPWRLNFPTDEEVQRAKESGALLTEEEKAAAVAEANRHAPSKFTGVYWNKKNRKWVAAVSRKRMGLQDLHVGYFHDEVEAAKAVDAAARRVRGEYAHGGPERGHGRRRYRLNFPTQEEVARAEALGIFSE